MPTGYRFNERQGEGQLTEAPEHLSAYVREGEEVIAGRTVKIGDLPVPIQVLVELAEDMGDSETDRALRVMCSGDEQQQAGV